MSQSIEIPQVDDWTREALETAARDQALLAFTKEQQTVNEGLLRWISRRIPLGSKATFSLPSWEFAEGPPRELYDLYSAMRVVI